MRRQNLIAAILIVTAQFVISCQSAAQKTVSTLQAVEFNQTMNTASSVQLVDVRTAEEFAGGHLVGAMNLDLRDPQFEAGVSNLNKEEPVFVYCLSGGRSASAANRLSKLGFTQVYDLKGGFLAWKNADLPIEGSSERKGMSMDAYHDLISADIPVLVDFYAPWCAPCRKMGPMLDELSANHSEAFKFVKLNADEQDGLMKELDINEIPTLLIYRNGEVSWQHIGLVEQEVLMKELGL